MTTHTPMPSHRPSEGVAAAARPMTTIQQSLASRIHDITHIAGEGNYSRVFFRSEQCEVFGKTLSWFEQNLPATDLIRLHKTVLVRGSAIVSWEQMDSQHLRVTMPRDSFWVARRRVNEVREQLEALAL